MSLGQFFLLFFKNISYEEVLEDEVRQKRNKTKINRFLAVTNAHMSCFESQILKCYMWVSPSVNYILKNNNRPIFIILCIWDTLYST